MNYQIEEWYVEPKHLRLSRGKETRTLEPRVMAVLEALIQAAPEPLSREALEQQVWGDIHVSETLVRRAISNLRGVLGDDARSPRFIDTIPRRGYALKVVPVFLDEAQLLARQNPEYQRILSKQKTGQERKQQVQRFVGACLVFVLGVFLTRWYISTPESPEGIFKGLVVPPGGVPISRGFQNSRGPTRNSSGTKVAFVVPWDGEDDIYIARPLGAGSENGMRLTFDGGQKTRPAFSPDGEVLAYGRMLPKGDFEVRLTATAWGSTPQTLYSGMGRIRDISWIKDSLMFSFESATPELDVEPNWRIVSLSTSSEPKLMSITRPMVNQAGDVLGSMDQAGQQLAFVRYYREGVGDIFLQEGSLPERKLTNLGGEFGDLEWDSSGGWLYFSFFENGRYVLKRVSPKGHHLEAVPFHYPVRQFEIAGRHLLFEHYRGVTEIWRGTLKSNSPPRAFIANGSFDSMPRYSHRGDQIAFISTRAGNRDIWLVDADGSNLRQLTSWGGAVLANPVWSPKDDFVAFEVIRGEETHIFQMNVALGEPVQMTFGNRDGMPIYAPDGQWLFYARRQADMTWRLRRMRLDRSADESLIMGSMDAFHVETGLDHALYLSTQAGGGIFYEGSGGGLVSLFSRKGLDAVNWRLWQDKLYFICQAGGRTEFGVYDLGRKKIDALRDLNTAVVDRSLDIAPQGSHYVFACDTGYRSDILMLPFGF